MPQRILGLDIGAWSVKGVLVESQFRGFKLLHAGEVRVPHGDAETLNERRTEAIRSLVGDPAMKADAYIAALPADVATARWITLPFADTKRVDQIIEGEMADLIPFPIEDAVFDHVLAKREDNSSLSIGVAASRHRVASRLELLTDATVDPRFLPLDAMQLSSLYDALMVDDNAPAAEPSAPDGEALTFVQESPEAPPGARLLIDIGHERTVVCAVNADGVHHTRVLRTGGKDVTEAIAKAYGLEWEDAERGKHEEAFVASPRHPAPDDDAQKISDAVSEGLGGLLREVRRTLQAIRKERRVRVERVDLMGGGASIRNLANYLAEQLNVPVGDGRVVAQEVERSTDPVRARAYCLALALALRGTSGQGAPRLDFRKEEFAFAGSLEHFRARVPFMAAAAGVLMFLLLVSVAVKYRAVVQHEAQIDAQFCRVTEEIIGREICEPSLAKNILENPESELGSFRLPERSAFTVAAELSQRMPEGRKLLVEKVNITLNRAEITGDAGDFEDVDLLVEAYERSACFKDIKKTRVGKGLNGEVEFSISVGLSCS